jgi:pimeloyl-ACP methyl ester carboxylesterase
MRAVLARDMVEGLRRGSAGLLRDLQLEASPWNLRFAGVTCPVSLWHGSHDTVVPPGALDALAALLPQAHVRRVAGAGHFFVFDAWAEILAWLLTGAARR